MGLGGRLSAVGGSPSQWTALVRVWPPVFTACDWGVGLGACGHDVGGVDGSMRWGCAGSRCPALSRVCGGDWSAERPTPCPEQLELSAGG